MGFYDEPRDPDNELQAKMLLLLKRLGRDASLSDISAAFKRYSIEERSADLSVLQQKDLVRVRKIFPAGKRPRVTISLTSRGKEAADEVVRLGIPTAIPTRDIKKHLQE